MMKKALIPALALVVASVAVPAAAQSYGHGPSRGHGYEQGHRDNWQQIAQRKYNLDRRIDRGERDRSLSRREASRLRGELNTLVNLERSYMRGGLSLRERRELDNRYDRLSAQVRYERRDNDNRRY